jgi:uncharacterized protein (DUF342 family)
MSDGSLSKFIETPDINQALEACAFEWELPIEEIDFSVEKEEISEDSSGNLLANYLINIFPLNKEEKNNLLLCNLNLELLENKALIWLNKIKDKDIENPTKSQLTYTAKNILKLMFLKQIKYGYLVEGTIEKTLKNKLTELSSNKIDNISFEVAKGIDPQNGKDSELKFHVPIEKIAGKLGEDGSIDFKNIGTADRIIKSGTEIATLYPATSGSNGMNIFGRVLIAKDGVDKHKIKIGTADTIEVLEDIENNCIKYIALSKGLVVYNQTTGQLDLKTEIETKEISYKNIGNITENSERLDMNIKGRKGTVDDAIKDGFELYAGNITVTGNIGNKVSIDCLSLSVEGKINSGSSIISKEFVKAKTVYGTTIISNFISIGTCMDSEIKGDFIIIDKVATSTIEGKIIIVTGSVKNCRFIAAELIIVGETFQMDNNILKIAPLELPEFKEKLEITEHKLKNFKSQVKQLEKEIEQANNKSKVLLKSITTDIIRVNELGYSVEKENSLSQLIENKQIQALKSRLKLSSATENKIDSFLKLKSKLATTSSQLNIKSKALEKFETEMEMLTNMFTAGVVLFISGAGLGTKVIFQSFEKIIQHNIKKTAYFFFDINNEKVEYKSADFSSLSRIWNNLPNSLQNEILEKISKLKNWHEPFEGIIQ